MSLYDSKIEKDLNWIVAGTCFNYAQTIHVNIKNKKEVSEELTKNISDFLQSCKRGREMLSWPTKILLGSLGEPYLSDSINYNKLFRPVVENSIILPKNLDKYFVAFEEAKNGDEQSAKLLKNLFWEIFTYEYRRSHRDNSCSDLALAS